MIVRFMPSFRENNPATKCQLKKKQPKKGYLEQKVPQIRSNIYGAKIPR
jgi:hypothetical protein